MLSSPIDGFYSVIVERLLREPPVKTEPYVPSAEELPTLEQQAELDQSMKRFREEDRRFH